VTETIYRGADMRLHGVFTFAVQEVFEPMARGPAIR
jgi:hypothetical protein